MCGSVIPYTVEHVKVLVTGATGYIGSRLAIQQADAGDTVHILYRSKHKAAAVAHPNIVGFPGSILDPDSVRTAMTGCRRVFHVAAVTSMWEPDSRVYHQTNVGGTEIVLRAALECGVERVVFTSTAGVFGPSLDGPVDEHHVRRLPPFSDYDRTKMLAEEKVSKYVSLGLDTVIVNPTRVFGPSNSNKLAPLNRFIKTYIEGRWRILPGNGRWIGNYVYIDDVTLGHRLAMESGRCGERYLLGGANLSYLDFYDLIGRDSGRPRFLIPVPLAAMLLFGHLQLAKTRLSGSPPLLTPAWARRIGYDYIISSDKAVEELGYSPRPIDECLSETVRWIRELGE